MMVLVSGTHPEVVQERLGHLAIMMTLDLYSHVIRTMQEEAANALDGAFRSAISGASPPVR
jgi:integrase